MEQKCRLGAGHQSSCCWIALLTNRAARCCWWGRKKNASSLWKEIMGYQAGEDALILPQRHCADAFFVVYLHPCEGVDVSSHRKPLHLLMYETRLG